VDFTNTVVIRRPPREVFRFLADLEGRGVVRIAAPLAAGRIREAVASNLGVLKDLLESPNAGL